MRKKNDKDISVSVIIPNYNGEKLLKKNLPGVIKAFKNKRNHIAEVIVVDDGSTDGSIDLLHNNFPQVKLVKHTENRGFSAAVNTGARTARGDLLVLVNSDVEVSDDFLVSALPHFRDKSVFAVSLHEKGYGWADAKFISGYLEHSSGEEIEKVKEAFWVSGGSGVFRRSMWMKLRGMDERLYSPYYWEDVDLSYRAMKRGWKVLWEPKANVLHVHESTIGSISKRKRQKIQERNQLLFLWKNITSPILFKKHLSGLLKRIARHPGYVRIVLLALSKLRVVYSARKKEKKESKVSDEAIFAKF